MSGSVAATADSGPEMTSDQRVDSAGWRAIQRLPVGLVSSHTRPGLWRLEARGVVWTPIGGHVSMRRRLLALGRTRRLQHRS